MDATRKKYPRSFHLNTSESLSDDDKRGTPEAHAHLASGIELVTSEKMDGSNFTIARDFCYGRSVDANSNLWDAPVRKLWAEIRWDLPSNILLRGENMWAKKSVSYENLDSVFLVFNIWQDNVLLSWDETIEWCELLGLDMVPTLYRGNSFKEASEAWSKAHTTDESEGFVIRNADRFPEEDFNMNLLKWVRKDHVRTPDDFRRRNDFPTNTFIKPF